MHESRQPNRLGGDANGGHATWHPALRSPVSLHVPALCTEHAWGRSVLQPRAEIMESPLVSALQRSVERVGSAPDADWQARNRAARSTTSLRKEEP